MSQSPAEARQQSQLAFEASGANLVVGDASACPLPPSELAALPLDAPCVVEHFGGGLTARVLHLCLDGRHFTLKQKRAKALVHNVDGQTSFLNEVQRRADFTRLKADPSWAGRFEHIVPTLFADYRQGIILSPWIAGEPLAHFDAGIFRQVLETAVACEEAGLMEWDLCPGNILESTTGGASHVWLFDFGYMYPFDPLRDFNSNGRADPLFHACERFETRNFFGWLLARGLPHTEELRLFHELKEVAASVYQGKLERLRTRGAEKPVLDWLGGHVARWQQALQSPEALERLFEVENVRSQVLDIEDDLHGKSCTPLTLRRVDYVLRALQERFHALEEGGALFYGNAGKSQAQLLEDYAQKRRLVEQYQIR